MSIDIQSRPGALPVSSPTTENHASSSSSAAHKNEFAISVRGVSKMYPLYANPRDRLKQSLWYALPRFLRGQPREFYQEFWALSNISFNVKQGETVGIIGRNGSGKSTLLQVIAGTLAPTHGEVRIKGRVAALLELGSGFNPEFTGRENIYLNGAIVGLSQAEIDELYDQIVAFANIGQFIDQPVKLYSSGMTVRLGFAIQAFVPKQVLVVDEALAVGDVAFQRKCMAVLEKFRNDGGTVLLVSQSPQIIVRHCDRCLLLSEGQLLVDGESKPVTDLYQKLMFSNAQEATQLLTQLRHHGLYHVLTGLQAEQRSQDDSAETTETPSQTTNHTPPPANEPADWFDPNMPQPDEVVYSNGGAEIIDYGMYNEQGQQVNVLVVGRRYRWTYKARFSQDVDNPYFGMMLRTIDGVDVAGISSDRERVFIDFVPASTTVKVSFWIRLNVAPGTYFLNAGIYGSVNEEEYGYLARRVDICMIRVLPRDDRESYGIVYLRPRFEYSFESEVGPLQTKVEKR